MHTSPFSAKNFAKSLNASLYMFSILSLLALSGCSSVGVSGMYATNTTAVPVGSRGLKTESGDNVFGATLFTEATALGSEISYFAGKNTFAGNKVSGLDFGLALRLPISVKRVTIAPFAGADCRYYLSGNSLEDAARKTGNILDAITENIWLKAGLGIDYAFTNSFFLKAEAGYSRQLASDRQKERYSTSFFSPAYGLKFRIGVGTYVGSAKKNFPKKKAPTPAAAFKPDVSTTSTPTASQPSAVAAITPAATIPSVPPTASKKTLASGEQVYIGATYKCQFSSQDTFQIYALKDIPLRYSSLTIFTEGVKDTMVAIITIEGAQAIGNQRAMELLFDDPDRYILALDDDSGENANAKVSVNVPRERAAIVMVVNKDKSAGNYTLTVRGKDSGGNAIVISDSEKAPVIQANRTYQRTFTSLDSSIHLYGLSDVASYRSLTLYTEGNLDTGLLIISANGAKTLADTGDPSRIQSKDILGYDTDSGTDYNAKATIAPPREGTCFVIVTSKRNGTYTLTVNGN
ncbi:MAG: hypothetical protein LBH85_01805 [Treponema sp.]|jgi:hypothetical protein|nr:hypothetical protein [Treponema sp.]